MVESAFAALALAAVGAAQTPGPPDPIGEALQQLRTTKESDRQLGTERLLGFARAATREWGARRASAASLGELPWSVTFEGSQVAVEPTVDRLIAALAKFDLAFARIRVRNEIGKPRAEFAIIGALGQLLPYLGEDRRDQIRPLAVKMVRNAFGFMSPVVRRAFFRLGVDAEAGPEALVALLKDENPVVREAAGEVIGILRLPGPEVVAALLEAIGSEHPGRVRIVFGGFRGTASQDLSTEIRSAAARAILQIAGVGEEAGVAGRYLLVHSEEDPDFRLRATRAVGFLGDKAKPALSRLLLFLRGSSPDLASEAATAIGMIGVLTPKVERGLAAAEHSANAAVAARAAATLRLLRRSQAEKPGGDGR